MRATLLLLFVIGCGDDDAPADAADPDSAVDARNDLGGDAHDGASAFMCSSLSDPDQCWNELAARLLDCIPEGEGILNAEHTECVYFDGTTITFDSAVPPSGDWRPNFTIRDPGGAECGAFSSGGNLIGLITIADKTASYDQVPGFPRATLTCEEDGARTVAFEASTSDFSECTRGDDPLVPPAYNALPYEHGLTFQIVFDGRPDSPRLLDCAGIAGAAGHARRASPDVQRSHWRR